MAVWGHLPIQVSVFVAGRVSADNANDQLAGTTLPADKSHEMPIKTKETWYSQSGLAPFFQTNNRNFVTESGGYARSGVGSGLAGDSNFSIYANCHLFGVEV